MSARDPKLWLAVLSLAAVVAITVADSRRTSPGALSAPHARVGELAGSDGCGRCHADSLAEGCTGCHAEIEAQLAQRSGLHGSLPDVARCEACHREHLGDALELAGDAAFARAGATSRDEFAHAHVEFALTGAHAELECAECHPNALAASLPQGETRFLGASQRCTACHDDPHAGRFVRGCEACHGQTGPFAELGNFAHSADFPLTGAHASSSCADCHEPGSERSVEALGGAGPHPPARACLDCHASPHTAGFGAAAAAALAVDVGASCARCHSTSATSFARAEATLDGDLHGASGFALDAPHDRATCEQCHGERAAFGAPRSPDDCAACHADPHGAQFDRSGAAARCIDCHSRAHFAPLAFDLAAHARTGFALDGAHASTACNECHTQTPGEPRRFRGTPQRCDACHADAHSGAFDGLTKAPARASCATCHSTAAFASATLTLEQHAGAAGFELAGAHARASCEACHPRNARPDALARSFGRAPANTASAPRTCATCHRDVHDGAFDDRHLQARVAGRDSCARCHSQERFDVLASAFDHGAWTNFALDGAHAAASCAACHGETQLGERRLGRVSEVFPGSPQRCDTCHADAHRGAFERVEPAVDCAQCHSTAAFADVRFEHERWTGFELAGAHAAAACEACHVPARQRDELGRNFGRAAGTSCAACHVDPHAGQFARGGATDCARCHTATGSFALSGFDHARDTRFALDAKHAELACNKCHVPWTTASGESVVRYRPLGTQCADCHGIGGKR